MGTNSFCYKKMTEKQKQAEKEILLEIKKLICQGDKRRVLEMGYSIMLDGTVYDRQGHKLGTIQV
jgi:hypothetical protein